MAGSSDLALPAFLAPDPPRTPLAPSPSRRAGPRRLVPAPRLSPYWRWRRWMGRRGWAWRGSAAPRLCPARPRPPLPPGLVGGCCAEVAPSLLRPAAGSVSSSSFSPGSPTRPQPLGSPSASTEPGQSGLVRIGSARFGRGAVGRPGRRSDGPVWPAGKEKGPSELQYQVGWLLGSGSYGSVYAGIRLSDSTPVSGGDGGRAEGEEEAGWAACSAHRFPWLAGGHQTRGPGLSRSMG